MEQIIITDVESIFEQGNLHMKNKLCHFGSQGQTVIKYIISKLRKYRGEFFESNSTIAEAIGCSVRTVQNAIKRAEQLEIFIVSSRTEMTFNDKFRQTSNKIQLLSYEVVEVVKEIVETIRTVTSKVVKKVKKVAEKYPKQQPQKAPIRTEIIPSWMEEHEEENRRIEEERLRRQKEEEEKYKDPNYIKQLKEKFSKYS